jgi:hypothetical protein
MLRFVLLLVLHDRLGRDQAHPQGNEKGIKISKRRMIIHSPFLIIIEDFLILIETYHRLLYNENVEN